MIRVCVSGDSTNQPVWNSCGLLQAWNTQIISRVSWAYLEAVEPDGADAHHEPP